MHDRAPTKRCVLSSSSQCAPVWSASQRQPPEGGCSEGGCRMPKPEHAVEAEASSASILRRAELEEEADTGESAPTAQSTASMARTAAVKSMAAGWRCLAAASLLTERRRRMGGGGRLGVGNAALCEGEGTGEGGGMKPHEAQKGVDRASHGYARRSVGCAGKGAGRRKTLFSK